MQIFSHFYQVFPDRTVSLPEGVEAVRVSSWYRSGKKNEHPRNKEMGWPKVSVRYCPPEQPQHPLPLQQSLMKSH